MNKYINNKEQPVVGVYIVSGMVTLYWITGSELITGKESLIFPLPEVTNSLYFIV